MSVPTHPIELLRFNTCGSVDDGKSTLIGRLLYDSKSIMEDQLEALERSADITGGGQINLANLTDGLRAEREQGITIDVAYRYFATPRRKFIVADTPGHVQYTRNMVTGASTANLSIVLVDARAGVIGLDPPCEAQAWIQASADQGHAPAQFIMGKIYDAQGIGGSAIAYYRMAAEQGHQPARRQLEQNSTASLPGLPSLPTPSLPRKAPPAPPARRI